MKIIGGIYKGFSLNTFSGYEIRPTPGKVREAVFDMLGNQTMNSEFLDLFAGTGAMGIEALSRGAQSVTFVDKNNKAIAIIKENLLKIRCPDCVKIIRKHSQTAIREFFLYHKKFDIVFIDPPYEKNVNLKLLHEIEQNPIIKKNGLLIMQHQVNEDLPDDIGRFEGLKKKKYGKTRITMYRFQEF